MNAGSGQLALTVAERLLRPADILEAAPDFAGGSLVHGLAGTALLHARLSAIDPVFADAATMHWAQAAIQARQLGDHGGGIYQSPGGLAASLIIGTSYLPDPDTHRTATSRAARWLSARAVDLADCYDDYMRAGGIGTPWHFYDTITGLAGIGRVLLAAVINGERHAEPGLLAALDTLTTMIHIRHGARPGWWVPAQQHPYGTHTQPTGAAATGMAHGIAGPLTLLALAHIAGWSVSNQPTAIRNSADWLVHWRAQSTGAWPPQVTGDEMDDDHLRPIKGRVDAWCYGIPGISRALTHAGKALVKSDYTKVADAAMYSLAERSADRWDVDGPTLCHGYAGVLQPALRNQHCVADTAAVATTAAFNAACRFGFQHHAHGSRSNAPGFLIGAAGVALALAEHSELPAPTVPARWDALLLLS